MKKLFKYLRKKTTSPVSDDEAFVRQCYLSLLGRPVDPGGLSNLLDKLHSPQYDHAAVIREITSSDEYLKRNGVFYHSTDPDIANFNAVLNTALVATLQSNLSIPQHRYETLWQSIFAENVTIRPGQKEYGRQHKQRFWELCNALHTLNEGLTKPKVLEFGISEFTGIYRQLFPNMELHGADRPIWEGYTGFDAQACITKNDGKQFISVDLNIPLTFFNTNYRELEGQYDTILFTEVLEHLTANPVDILKQLLWLLKPSGNLYLTTPNFFRGDNLRQISRRKNPQPVFPDGDNNWDAHHHFREYGWKELLEYVDAAVGQTQAYYFSDCWDTEPAKIESEKGNMIFVIQHKGKIIAK